MHKRISFFVLAAVAGFAGAPSSAQARTAVVAFHAGYDAGTVVISMRQRKLYYVLNGGSGDPISGRGRQAGQGMVGAMRALRANIQPSRLDAPAVVRADHPELPPIDQGRFAAQSDGRGRA